MPSALQARRGPILADGVALADLIDFDKREIAMRVLSDPEIYRLELKRVFARSWVALGHAAEIPNPGDYVKRQIGLDQVIVVRGRDGEVNVLLNACAHRGMEICWADEGNQSSFKCPYHGWVFDTAGNLMGAPFEREMYGDWDKSQYGLRKLRVGMHRGRIFANFDQHAPPLDEWLGDAVFYLDLPYAEGDPEVEICLSPRRFRVANNWKLPADNNSGDTYHGITLHRSLFELGMVPGGDVTTLDTLKVTAGGHGLVGFNRTRTGAPPKEGLSKYHTDNFTFSCVLFPASFGIGGSAATRMPGPDGRSYLVIDIGGIIPSTPDVCDMWVGRLVEKSAPEPLKAMLQNAMLLDLGGADDIAAWPSIQRVAKGAVGETQPIRYGATAGETKPADWAGPGKVYTGPGFDDTQWNWWMRWFELMTADEASEAPNPRSVARAAG
jgi:phenylpropionate dioxygenase-like ring-hydroxylating dioxygenase large terminal subunit